jgi:hypothetical protein
LLIICLGMASAVELPSSDTQREATSPKLRPLGPQTIDHGRRFTVSQITQALTLRSVGLSAKQIERKLNYPYQTVLRWERRAKDRGWDPNAQGLAGQILMHHVETTGRTGRPRHDKADREISSEVPGYELAAHQHLSSTCPSYSL